MQSQHPSEGGITDLGQGISALWDIAESSFLELRVLAHS